MPWIALDLVTVFIFFQMGIWLSPFGIWGKWLPPHIMLGAVFAISYCTANLGLGSYDRVSRSDFSAITRTTIISTCLASFISLSLFYFIFYAVVGRWTVLYGTVAVFIGPLAVRIILAWLLRKNPYRFTIIGNSHSLDEVIQFCATRRRNRNLYLYKPWNELFPNSTAPTIERLLAAKIGDIVLTSSVMNDPVALDFAIHSLQAKFRVVDESTFYAQVLERFPIDDVSKAWLLQQGIARRKIFDIVLKRLFDIGASAVALLLLSPFFAAIAIAIKISSPGPIFFNQMRQGRYSQPFKMYKFRTMHRSLGGKQASGGFTKENDSRVTSIGKILRPLHLDELPQFLNILLGDMSLVGPRPEAFDFARRMRQEIPLYDLRYLVRPGLTGHAQLNQGYAMDNVLDTKTKLSYDLYYLCFHSVWVDLQLVLRTIFFLSKRSR